MESKSVHWKDFTNLRPLLATGDRRLPIWKADLKKRNVVIKQLDCHSFLRVSEEAQIQNYLAGCDLGDLRVPSCELLIQEHGDAPPYFSAYLLMDHIKGLDLFNDLHAYPYKWTFPFIVRIFKKCVEAIQTFVALRVILNDIKLENFLLTASQQVVGIDFGNAYLVSNDYEPHQVLDYRIESKPYSSPQSLTREYCPAITNMVWSLGVMLYFMVFYEYPFGSDPDLGDLWNRRYKKPQISYEQRQKRLFPMAKKESKLKEVTSPTSSISSFSSTDSSKFPVASSNQDKMELTSNLIGRMLQPDWRFRLPLDEVLLHPFFMLQ